MKLVKWTPSFEDGCCYDPMISRILGALSRGNPLSPDQFPLFSHTSFATPPFHLSFFFCSKLRPKAFRFFYEMITQWLIPGKRQNAPLQFAIDFFVPEWNNLHCMCGEVMLQIETEKELEILKRNLPAITSEILLGIESLYLANRLLEIKGLRHDEKIALIQEDLSSLIKKRPQDFDYDLFTEMQHFLVLCKEEFKEGRSCRHLSRILCAHYLFRKALATTLEAFPDRRYFSLKVMRGYAWGKKVVGVALAMSFLRENELFEERHFLSAIQSVIPSVHGVRDSFFAGGGSIKTFYLEVEKETHAPFDEEEITKLKEELATHIKSRIEERMSPVFMPENEEEIMRHILTLSGQVKYVRDLPQAVINFHKQTQEELEFLVVMIRVATIHARTLQEIFERRKTRLKISQNRTKVVGHLRNKYDKIADVFRVTIAKAPFLRQDHSIDLYKARREIAQEMVKLVGDFRDYNGGIISKESEQITLLKELLGKTATEHAFLLENFFYSLSPAIMRSVLSPEPLKKFFTMLIEGEEIALESTEQSQFLIQEDGEYFYLLLTLPDPSCRAALEEAIRALKIPSLQLATCFVKSTHHPCFGVIYRNSDHTKSMALQLAIEKVVNENVKLFL